MRCTCHPPRGLGLLAALVLVSAGCSDSIAPDPVSGPQDQIFFVSDRDGELSPSGQPLGAIYRMNLDGTGLRRLTAPGSYHSLRLSPAGDWLAFHGDGQTCIDVFAMRTTDTVATRLTGVAANERCNSHPRWSPDGAMIAFLSSRDPTFCWDAYVMKRDGSGVLNVSNNPYGLADLARCNDQPHDWSPDGRIVLLSSREGSRRTYLVRADNAAIEPVAVLGDSVIPYWSPDGRHIAYQRTRGDDGEIHVIDAGGGPEVNLSNDPTYDYFTGWTTPWSPNARQLAFTSLRTGDREIWVVNTDGSGLLNVTRDPGSDEFLQWLPDGNRILFASSRTGDQEIYTVNADGTGLRNLTSAPGVNDFRAVWVPLR